MTTTISEVSSKLTPTIVAAGSLSRPAVMYLPLADGAEGTFQSLDWMAACVRGECPPDFSGYQDECIRQAAEAIVARVPGHDADGEIAALLLYARDRITYRKHPWNQQRVQDCWRTLELGSGDCVSKSVCLATLLAALGYPARFVAQSADGREYSHVYVEVMNEAGQWIALDPVYAQAVPGWSQQLPAGGFETTWTILEEA